MSFFERGWSTPPPYGAGAGGQPVSGAGSPGCVTSDRTTPGGNLISGHGVDVPPGDVRVWTAVRNPDGSNCIVYCWSRGYELTSHLNIVASWDHAPTDAEVDAACAAAPAPPPQLPAPVPGLPFGEGVGAACGPLPCLPPAPKAATDAKVHPTPPGRQPDVGCLPGWVHDLTVAVQGKSLGDLLKEWGYCEADGRQHWGVAAEQYLNAQDSWWSGTLKAIVAIAETWSAMAINGIQVAAQQAEKAVGCSEGAATLGLALKAFLGVWHRWVGQVPEPMDTAVTYLVNYACPTELPSQAEANRAWTAGTFNNDEWLCVTRANGNDPVWANAVLNAEEHWPSLEAVVSMERRIKLTPEERTKLYTRAGVWHEDAIKWHKTAAEFVPTPTDASEWMSKDLGDPLLTQTFGLFNEFYQKYRGDVKDALDYSGVSEKWARLIFASHRGKAAPHQMYEMHKRLRPGWWALLPAEDALHMAQAIAPRRPTGEGGLLEQASNLQFLGQQREANALYGSDPAAVARFGAAQWVKPVVSPDPKIPVPDNLVGLPPQWLDEIGNNPEAARAYLAETVTTGFHVFEGLSQANYPPFWRARLLALSYNVMTRVDMRRAYETGQIDKETLFQKLQDRGYTPVDARYLANFYEVAATQLASRRPAVNAWVTDGYEISLLQQALLDQGMREEMWPAVKRIAETRRQIYVQQRCIRHLKKLVLAGLVEEPAIAPRLVSVGLTGPEAARLSSEWSCERRSIPKPESAATVCKYLTQQLIGPEQAARLIHRLGYTYREARRMVNSCLLTPVRKGTGKRDQLPGKVLESKLGAPPEDPEAGVSAEDRVRVATLRQAVAAAPPGQRAPLQQLLDDALKQIGAQPGAEQVLIPGEQPEG
jgi:hypothetical protein